MNENNKSCKKDELLQKLSDAKSVAHELVSKGREILKEGQIVADLAAFNEDFICHFPNDSFLPPREWDDQITIWNGVIEGAVEVSSVLDETPKQFTSAASLGTSVVISSEYIPRLPSSSQEAARKTYESYELFLEQSNPIEKIEIEIHRLGLSSPTAASESILSLILQSKQAYQIPSHEDVSPSAVLIPLREAINLALANLLPKRPRQERAKNKVRSICTQCCKPAVNERQIEQLAQEAYNLNDELSGAKQRLMTREQVRELMNRGIQFLYSFLRALDETKMRK